MGPLGWALEPAGDGLRDTVAPNDPARATRRGAPETKTNQNACHANPAQMFVISPDILAGGAQHMPRHDDNQVQRRTWSDERVYKRHA